MWRSVFGLLFALPLWAAELTAQPRIIGGVDVAATSWPWMVSIGYESSVFLYDAHRSHFCGGTLIDPLWVVTAAHCVGNKTAQELALQIGEGDLAQTTWSGRQRVAEIIIHPHYVAATFDNDIALLQLHAPILSEYVPLAAKTEVSQLTAVDVLHVLGWGDMDPTELTDTPSRLQKAELWFVPTALCSSIYGSQLFDSMLCAAAPDKDSCQGDSGGPLVLEQDGRFRQVGIVSWGLGCANPEFPGVYTRLSNYDDWIAQTLGLASNPSDGDNDRGDNGGAGASSWLMLALLLLAVRRRLDVRQMRA